MGAVSEYEGKQYTEGSIWFCVYLCIFVCMHSDLCIYLNLGNVIYDNQCIHRWFI